jgi:hypothetical protein
MKSLFVAIALFVTSCAHTPTPAPSVDAGGPVTCASVCDRGTVIGCLWAQPTPHGASCEAVCLNAANAGQPWDLRGLASATSCP